MLKLCVDSMKSESSSSSAARLDSVGKSDRLAGANGFALAFFSGTFCTFVLMRAATGAVGLALIVAMGLPDEPGNDGKSAVKFGLGTEGFGCGLFFAFTAVFCGFLNKAVAAEVDGALLDGGKTTLAPPSAGKFSFVLTRPFVPNIRVFSGALGRSGIAGPLPSVGNSCSFRASMMGVRLGCGRRSPSSEYSSSYLQIIFGFCSLNTRDRVACVSEIPVAAVAGYISRWQIEIEIDGACVTRILSMNTGFVSCWNTFEELLQSIN